MPRKTHPTSGGRRQTPKKMSRRVEAVRPAYSPTVYVNRGWRRPPA